MKFENTLTKILNELIQKENLIFPELYLRPPKYKYWKGGNPKKRYFYLSEKTNYKGHITYGAGIYKKKNKNTWHLEKFSMTYTKREAINLSLKWFRESLKGE